MSVCVCVCVLCVLTQVEEWYAPLQALQRAGASPTRPNVWYEEAGPESRPTATSLIPASDRPTAYLQSVKLFACFAFALCQSPLLGRQQPNPLCKGRR